MKLPYMKNSQLNLSFSTVFFSLKLLYIYFSKLLRLCFYHVLFYYTTHIFLYMFFFFCLKIYFSLISWFKLLKQYLLFTFCNQLSYMLAESMKNIFFLQKLLLSLAMAFCKKILLFFSAFEKVALKKQLFVFNIMYSVKFDIKRLMATLYYNSKFSLIFLPKINATLPPFD